MKAYKISERYVEKFWVHLYEDFIPIGLRGLNFNNPMSIEQITNEHLMVELKATSVSNQERTKNSLKYAINFWDEHKLKDAYDGGMPAIGLPTAFSCREFYIYIWNQLFPNESHIINDKSLYTDIGQFFDV